MKTRKQKINQVASSPTTRIVFDNRSGRKTYHVDSIRTGKPFQVNVEWELKPILKATCQLFVFDSKEQVNDKGNHIVDFCRTTVCYQALGALKSAAKKAGKILSVCPGKDSLEKASRLLRFGGELVKITNLGGGVVWATLR